MTGNLQTCGASGAVRRIAWLLPSCALAFALAGCASGPFSLVLSSTPAEGSAAPPGDKPAPPNGEAPKPEAKPAGPHTLPEAMRQYLRCLCGDSAVPVKTEKEPKGESKSLPAAQEPAKNGTESKTKEESKKSEEKEGSKGKEKEKEKDAEKDAEKEKEREKEKEPEATWYSAHAQATIVTQEHDKFRSPYVGPLTSPYVGALSLLPEQPSATSITSTLFFAARVWEGGEIIFNPEVAGGTGFSQSSGIASFPNGEITRVGVVEPTPYIARLFLRQTFDLGDEEEKVEDTFNQVAGKRAIERLTVTIGKFTNTDLIDDNRYSHDPRTSFLNWGLMYNVAWDYPANVRGYTYGIGLDYNQKNWALRYSIAAEPLVANGAPIDPHFLKANGQIIELEERYTLNDHPGKLRLWAYANRAHMGKYSEAIERMPVSPDVTQTRAYRFKVGAGGNLEQELTRDLGMFVKWGWNDGHSESWAFTAVDATLATGLVLKGRCWCRPDDLFGLGFVANGLSDPHRDYLAAGGFDFNIGDGRLRYGLEKILESYYALQIHKGIFFTLDYQLVEHPAYNRDRGPVSVATGRFHIEF